MCLHYSNLIFQPIDGAKEDFRRYLDRKGVMDTLTKAFISCYDDRPENPIERLLEVLSDTSRQLPSNYRTKLETAELKLVEAKAEIELLRKQLDDLGVKPAVVEKPPNSICASIPTPSTPSISATVQQTEIAALTIPSSPPPPVPEPIASVTKIENIESAKSGINESVAPNQPAATTVELSDEKSAASTIEENPSTSS